MVHDRRGRHETFPVRERSISVMKLVSWNLLRRTGATVAEVAALIERESPDLMLMQEAGVEFGALPEMVGGAFVRTPLPGRHHGLAMWMPQQPAKRPLIIALPAGAIVERVSQIVDLGAFSVANVHLSHGQLLNRRQLRRIARRLPAHAAVVGDFNLVGPVLLPDFRDVGPRRYTHRMSDVVPLRLDRCIVRGLVCTEAAVLPRGTSDHRPIMMRLALAGPAATRAEFMSAVAANT
jgi:endonuclease/exonuclease/phosphatase (EEP) superfamily protein YafD